MTKGALSGGSAVPEGDPGSIDSRVELAAALTALRERTGLSVRDLARAVDSPVATVGGYVSGRHLPTVAQSAVFVRILAACGVTDPVRQQAWWDAVARVRRAGAPRPASVVSPYPGLDSFQVQDAGLFFGREKLTAQLLAAVRGDAAGPRVGPVSGASADPPAATTGRMVAVVGPSGSGKSSLVRAGLVPAWAGSGDDVGGPARYSIITPGDRPLQRLAAALVMAGSSGGGSPATGRSDPADPTDPAAAPDRAGTPDRAGAAGSTDPAGAPGSGGSLDGDEVTVLARSLLADPAGAAAHAPGADHLLVVDQFEEVFSTCPDEHERQAYLVALGAIAGAGAGAGAGAEAEAEEGAGPTARPAAVPVVIVLRADFYALAIAQAALLPVLAGAQVVVGPMTPDEVRRAVVEPARIAGCEVDPELVEVLIGDLTPHGAPTGALDAGALPLLSHALSGTWQRASRRRLTVADYRATGGVGGAVAQSAESVLAALPARHQALAARMLLRMVNVDEDAVVTRRRMPLADLVGLPDGAAGRGPGGNIGRRPDGAADPAVDGVEDARDVVDRFVAARLMTVDADAVQISHEALLSAWPRLQGWIDESRAALGARRRLDDAIRFWQDSGQDASALLGPTRLAAMQEALAAGSLALSAREREFLAASEAAVTAARHARVRGRRRRRLIVAVVTTLAVVASGLAVFAVVSGRAAAEQQRAAEAFRQLALAGQVLDTANRVAPLDSNIAGQLALVAYRTSPTAEDRSAVLDATGAPLVTRVLGAKGPTMQALSPDGRLLATADGADGSVRLLSVTDRERPTVVGTAPAAAPRQQFSIAFSPDGHLLATGGSKGVVQLWDVADPSRPTRLGQPIARFPSGVFGVVFTPDGRTLLAAGEGGTIARWSLDDPADPVELPGLPTMDLVGTMALSRDGSVLAVGGRDADVQLWSLAGPGDPSRIAAIPGPRATSSTFSPDGTLLAIGRRDGSVEVWNVADPTAPVAVGARLMPFTSIANVVAFSGDGSVLAAGGADGMVRAWRTANWAQEGQLGHPAPITGLSVSADGGHLTSSAADGTTRLWAISGTAIGTLPDSVFSLAWRPDGRDLAVAAGPAANGVSFWNVARGDHPALEGTATPPDPAARYGGGVAITRDGSLMVATLTDGRVQLWDVADPARPAPIGPPLSGPTGIVQQVVFSADGTRMAIAADDASVWLWNVADPAIPVLEATMSELSGPAYSVTFGAGDRVLAAATTAGEALVWTLADPTHPVLASTIEAGQSYSFAVTISPDGRQLAVAGADREIRRWDIVDPAHPVEIGSAIGGPANDVYWLDYSPDGRLLAAASTDRNVWLWDVGDPARPVLYATLGQAAASLYVARFDPSGRTIAAGGADHRVHQWLTDPADARDRICATVGTPLTEQEWQVYLPGQPYDPPCG